jgi:glyoxylase-like metal-dependent hydrolase (beta-lactamase superfamily II)
MEITEVAPNTFLINPASESEFSLGEIVYLLVDTPSVLIEPGSTTTASRLLSRSAALGLDLDGPVYVIPTHIHVDHGGGSGFLARQLPQAQVVLHPRGAAHLAEPARLIESTRLVFGPDFEQIFGPILPVPTGQIHVARDGEVLHLGHRDLTVIFAPGHASHHLAIFDSLTQGLFCGEGLGIIPDAMPDFPLPAAVIPFDLDLYLQTIDRLARLPPRLLFYSHCGLGRNADELIRQVRDNTTAFAGIVREGLEQEESDQQIWQRLMGHIRQRFPGVEVPDQYQMTLSGYISYFRGKQS